jgi:hypothetical protein
MVITEDEDAEFHGSGMFQIRDDYFLRSDLIWLLTAGAVVSQHAVTVSPKRMEKTGEGFLPLVEMTSDLPRAISPNDFVVCSKNFGLVQSYFWAAKRPKRMAPVW